MTTMAQAVGCLVDFADSMTRAAGDNDGYGIVNFLFDTGAGWHYKKARNGDFISAKVRFEHSPTVEFNSATGVIRVQASTSTRDKAVAGMRLPDATRKAFHECFAHWFKTDEQPS